MASRRFSTAAVISGGLQYSLHSGRSGNLMPKTLSVFVKPQASSWSSGRYSSRPNESGGK